jgi:GTP-binding protein HflX
VAGGYHITGTQPPESRESTASAGDIHKHMLQTAIIAQRVAAGEPDTAEIRRLTEAAGAQVCGEVTQRRSEDTATDLGAGAVSELATQVETAGADTVVVDGDLTPQQTVNLEAETGARVVDRQRLVLEIFAREARSRRAQLQVELARLRYQLPRVRERTDEGALNRFTESGTRYYDLLDRIDELERKLDDLPPVEREYRERREQGFDLVAVAGYTNAGKSTLLRRLADEMSLSPDSHDDIEESATADDHLFETLETTTRRATVAGRPTLLTDTVGFLDDLPHWLVESFRGTLSAVENADAVVLVVDAAQPVEELRRKLQTVLDTVEADHPPLVPVLNKTDLVERDRLAERRAAVEDLAGDPVGISASEGTGIETLERRITDALPALDRVELTVPLTDEGMSTLSWLHDEAVEVDVEYGPEAATARVAARPATVEQARARVERLDAPTVDGV